MTDKFDELVEELKAEYARVKQILSDYTNTLESKDRIISELYQKLDILGKNAVPQWLDLNKFKLTRFNGKIYVCKTINIKIKYVSFDGESVYSLNNQHSLGNVKVLILIDPLTNNYEHSLTLKNGNLFKSFHTSGGGICAPIPSVINSNEKLKKVFDTIEDALNTVNLSSVYDPPYSISLETIESILNDIERVAKDNNIDAKYCEKCRHIMPNCVGCIYCAYFDDEDDEEEEE